MEAYSIRRFHRTSYRITAIVTLCSAVFILPARVGCRIQPRRCRHYAVLNERAGNHNLQINSSPVNGSTSPRHIGIGSYQTVRRRRQQPGGN